VKQLMREISNTSMPNGYMISLTNSTTLAAMMEVVGFALIHLVNLSTTMMKMCVNPPFAFFNGPTKSSPHVEKV
jgi:hypothetical protein